MSLIRSRSAPSFMSANGNAWATSTSQECQTPSERVAAIGIRNGSFSTPSASSQRVIRGGSFLCAENDCRNYRPSARHGTDWDTGLSNLGFRCVKDVDIEIIPAKTIAPALTPATSEKRSPINQFDSLPKRFLPQRYAPGLFFCKKI